MLDAIAMVSVNALTPERLRLALDWQDLHCVNRYLSFFCPAFVQLVKSGHKPVTATVTLVLPHQLILELQLGQAAEGAAPEQIRLDRGE